MGASRNTLSNDLLNRVGAFVAARTSEDEPLLVGLSGGCDSVVLLHLLTSLGLGSRLSAIHVHHGLSPNADLWANFCRRFCQQLDVPLQVMNVAVDRDSGQGIEAAARHARYTAFSAAAGKVIFLAHHQGDQAETLLFNLLRGSGVAGAAAMLDERFHGTLRILRPLLSMPRATLLAYAEANGLVWVNDESNEDSAFSRNFLRHEVLSIINRRFSSAEQNLAQAARHFSEAATLLDELAEADWKMTSDGEVLNLSRLRTLTTARIKNLLRYRLRQLGWGTPATVRLEEFVRQLQSAGADRHPELKIGAGVIRAGKGRVSWVADK
jgi:tRNA(Ile)-lysidine synthase